MNDRRFLELLNLYIDGQIDAAEAAALEAEVLSDPERRRVYDDYCRLQRACSLLGDGARSAAPSSQAFARSLRDAERKIAAPRRAAWRPSYAGAFSMAAMAACVAVVFVVNQRPRATTGGEEWVADGSGAVASPVHAAASLVAVSPLGLVESSPLAINPAVSAVARNAREVEIASTDREALEWMQRVELLPGSKMVVDEQAFETRPTLHPDNRVFRSRHSMQGNAEFTAFQFQR